MPLLEKNYYEIGSIMFEWDCLKVQLNSFLKNEEDYLSILKKIFSSKIKNILNIIKILLITAIANAKLEQMF